MQFLWLLGIKQHLKKRRKEKKRKKVML